MSAISELRHAAHAAGKIHFDTGQPCKRGHTAPRFVSNGGCIKCVNLKTVRVGPGRAVLAIHMAVDSTLTGADRIALENYLWKCAGTFHESRGVVLPLHPDALRWAEMEGRPVSECPF